MILTSLSEQKYGSDLPLNINAYTWHDFQTLHAYFD